jgi:predicted  nucleic acid-binding Zn-ribbon protein
MTIIQQIFHVNRELIQHRNYNSAKISAINFGNTMLGFRNSFNGLIEDYQRENRNINTNQNFNPSRLMIRIMETLLGQNEDNLIQEFDIKMQRYMDFNNYTNYKDIIILFEELVRYNKYGIREIVEQVNNNLNFSMEISGVRISANEVKIKDDFNIFYQKFLGDVNTFLSKIDDEYRHSIANVLEHSEEDERTATNLLNTALGRNITELDRLRAELSRLQERYTNAAPHELNNLEIQMQNIQREINDLNEHIRNTQSQIITQQSIENNAARAGRTTTASTDYSPHLPTADKLDLELIKTELGLLYDKLLNIFTTPELFQIFLDENLKSLNEFNYAVSMDTNRDNANENLFLLSLRDIDRQASYCADIVDDLIISGIEARVAENLTNPNTYETELERIRNLIIKNIFDGDIANYIKNKILSLLIIRVFRLMHSRYKGTQTSNEMEFKELTGNIHPLLKKIIRNPNHFKSYIFDIDQISILYELIYHLDIQKFGIQANIGTNGRSSRPPRKYTVFNNKLEYILDDILQLKNNPIWIISNKKVHLSIPDYLSMTHDRVIGYVPRDKIKDYCKFDYKNVWTERDIGNVLGQDSKELKNNEKELNKLINQLKNTDNSLASCKKKNDPKCKNLKTTKSNLEKLIKAKMALINLGVENIENNHELRSI